MLRDFEDKICLINDFLSQNLWMDFEVCKMNGGEIILSGQLDEMDDELIEIKFIQPFYISIPLSFSFEKGNFISLITGDEFIQINKQYEVIKGNNQFRISPNEEADYLVIAQDIEVIIRKEF